MNNLRFVLMWAMACGCALAQTGGACSQTSQAIARACQFEAESDLWVARGKCNNLSDSAARAQCELEAEQQSDQAERECNRQFAARQDVCRLLGPGPYDPQIDPNMFVDPADIGDTVQPNRYYPLVRGRKLTYKGKGETITVEVTGETQVIAGVRVAVVRDRVVDDATGQLIEDTVDWFAQDVNGNVWYMGEIAMNFEGGLLKDLAGSWTAGEDGAKAGIIMNAAPQQNAAYRQEFALTVAEDLAQVTSVNGSAQTPAASCAGTCVVTRDFTPLEPGASTLKYYAPGVGTILEVDEETGERVELVAIESP